MASSARFEDSTMRTPLIPRLESVLSVPDSAQRGRSRPNDQNCGQFLVLFTKALIAQHSSQKPQAAHGVMMGSCYQISGEDTANKARTRDNSQ